MPYVVYALKWRPKNFDEIVGQDQAVTTLKNSLLKKRVANAYLFAGPRGVGKTSTARILAKALNCKEGPTVNPCQKCSSCREIADARSLDVIEIDGASNRGIEDIRTLRENVKFLPSSGKYKIYIIDEVHMLTPEAFNALLKTLEEPPEFVKFIFATTLPGKILPTILSRCQRLDFKRISSLEIISQLDRIAKAEGLNIDRDVLLTIAKSSDGALRDAESILDQLVSFSQGKISLQETVKMLGIVEQDALFEITEKIIRKDSRGVLEDLAHILDEGKDAQVFLHNLIEHYRNLMVAKIAGADAKLIDLPEDICTRIVKQADSLSLEEILSAFNTLASAQEMAKRVDFLKIPLEVNLVKLAHDKKTIHLPAPISEKPVISKPPEPLKVSSSSQKKQASAHFAQATVVAIENEKETTLEEVKRVWGKIVDDLRKVRMSVASYLAEGDPITCEHNILTVAFPINLSLHKESLDKLDNHALIEKNLQDLLNTRVRIEFILSKDFVKKEKVLPDNPMINSALDFFNGRVIESE